MKTQKLLRKIENNTIMVVTDNADIIDKVNNISNNIRELVHYDNTKDALALLKKRFFDVILLDNKLITNKFLVSLDKIENGIKILVTDNYSDEKLRLSVEHDFANVLVEPLNIEQLKYSIFISLNQTKRNDKIKLRENIYFDEYRDQFFQNKSLLKLTALEFKFLKFLLQRKENISNYQDIQKNVWEDKEMSIFTMRNIVNKIRQKTYYNIIANYSSKGYTIDPIVFK
jgi:DNA-binding response OmpR family regulator